MLALCNKLNDSLVCCFGQKFECEPVDLALIQDLADAVYVPGSSWYLWGDLSTWPHSHGVLPYLVLLDDTALCRIHCRSTGSVKQLDSFKYFWATHNCSMDWITCICHPLCKTLLTGILKVIHSTWKCSKWQQYEHLICPCWNCAVALRFPLCLAWVLTLFPAGSVPWSCQA